MRLCNSNLYTHKRIYSDVSKIKTAKVFKSGNSQAVRLPKEFRIDAREVYIKRNGGNLKLMPREDAWKVFSESLSLFTDDFMESRKQPTQRKRGELFD